ncbi:hypothetical protein ACOMHN_009946 [Nucella lapillus]
MDETFVRLKAEAEALKLSGKDVAEYIQAGRNREAEREERLAQADHEAAERQAQADREAAERQAQADREAAERQAQADREAAERQAQADREAAERLAQADREAAERLAQADREAAERLAQADHDFELELLRKIKNQAAAVTTFIASTQTFDDRQGALCEVCDKVPFDPKCIVTVQGVNTMAIRDTGATTTVVSKCLVPKACFTGKTQTVTLASKDAKGELPTAIVVMDTPYFHGKTEVLVMDDPVVPVLIGNTRKHDKTLEAVPVYPRANTAAAVQSKPDQNKVETLSVKSTPLGKITPKELKEEQSKDPSLSKCMAIARKGDLRIQRTNGVSSRYVLKKGILKRIVKSGGKEEHQVVVPKPFRKAVLRVAHDIPMKQKETCNR